ncbi:MULTISPECIES: signal recognition particle-docking protein FtsY [Ureibacillus]|jgi:fused signal recognition particle receptor|uniref:Signal recognition particle receptor FtsY n=1 Tax=Ureibacillus thermosphaericus TaxID=51173 RepID=A0A840PVD4_URETH|nr:signal recognition particle-docking protein FtsY [Ureibacillus thermosphaericus]MBB5149893.1 fused signal recognition particle receptor [Ureibacillus thermosphaericus]NKZ30947.1 signal recognition particle-docking protein FtsY [Ureibacillus thermosphaericus]
MSFFKRLKEKLSGKSEEKLQQDTVEETAEQNEDVQNEADDVGETSKEVIEEKNETIETEETFSDDSEKAEETLGDDVETVQQEDEKEEEKKPSAWSITQKFKMGLAKTRDTFTSKVNDLIARYRKVDEEFFEELEEILLQADVGFETVMELMDELRFEVQRKNIKDTDGIYEIICEKLVEIYEKGEEGISELNLQPNGELTVILFVGVNGVGKTTTIGKLAHRLKNQGKKVMLAAGDTFRAGAIEQLQVWGDRVGCEVIKQSEGSDPAAVIYDAINAAKKRGVDVLICDTAGRLQNKVNLMKELEKVHRVISREIPNAPHEVLLALDATTGQNALIQAQTFKEATNVTGIVLTKLDGTAKGGIVLAIRNKLNIPVKFVGLGEKIDDLQPFDAERYVYGLFADSLDQELKKAEQ